MVLSRPVSSSTFTNPPRLPPFSTMPSAVSSALVSIAHVDTHAVIVHHGSALVLGCRYLHALYVVGQQYHTRTSTGHKADHDITADTGEGHHAETAALVGLQINAQQRRALIYRGAVHRPRLLIDGVHGTDKAVRLTVTLGQFPYQILYVAHSATL